MMQVVEHVYNNWMVYAPALACAIGAIVHQTKTKKDDRVWEKVKKLFKRK